jgi:chromate transporter
VREKLKLLITIYISFLKIGGLTIGGGYAMISIIQKEAVDNRHWLTDEEMTNFITIGQSLPGVVGINTATAVGKKTAGTFGAVAAALGMITPSIIIILIISLRFSQAREIVLLQKAFAGVRAAVAALIANAVIRIAKTAVKDVFGIALALFCFICVVFFDIMPPYVLAVCAVTSAVAPVLINFLHKKS